MEPSSRVDKNTGDVSEEIVATAPRRAASISLGVGNSISTDAPRRRRRRREVHLGVTSKAFRSIIARRSTPAS